MEVLVVDHQGAGAGEGAGAGVLAPPPAVGDEKGAGQANVVTLVDSTGPDAEGDTGRLTRLVIANRSGRAVV